LFAANDCCFFNGGKIGKKNKKKMEGHGYCITTNVYAPLDTTLGVFISQEPIFNVTTASNKEQADDMCERNVAAIRHGEQLCKELLVDDWVGRVFTQTKTVPDYGSRFGILCLYKTTITKDNDEQAIKDYHQKLSNMAFTHNLEWMSVGQFGKQNKEVLIFMLCEKEVDQWDAVRFIRGFKEIKPSNVLDMPVLLPQRIFLTYLGYEYDVDNVLKYCRTNGKEKTMEQFKLASDHPFFNIPL
jgi:hypothetical protein